MKIAANVRLRRHSRRQRVSRGNYRRREWSVQPYGRTLHVQNGLEIRSTESFTRLPTANASLIGHIGYFYTFTLLHFYASTPPA
jgi:hypothetical protein